MKATVHAEPKTKIIYLDLITFWAAVYMYMLIIFRSNH